MGLFFLAIAFVAGVLSIAWGNGHNKTLGIVTLVLCGLSLFIPFLWVGALALGGYTLNNAKVDKAVRSLNDY